MTDIYGGYDGSVAYEAFKKDAQAHEEFSCKIPWSEFEDLPSAIRARWKAVEEAVCKRFGAIY